MGSDAFSPEERPAHRVHVDGFWMDESPVTNAAYSRFVEATGYLTVAERTPDPDDYPGIDPALLVPGSLVFRPPPHRVSLRDRRVVGLRSRRVLVAAGGTGQHAGGPRESSRRPRRP